MIVLALVLIFIAVLGIRSDLERIARALERVGRIDRCVQNIKDAREKFNDSQTTRSTGG